MAATAAAAAAEASARGGAMGAARELHLEEHQADKGSLGFRARGGDL